MTQIGVTWYEVSDDGGRPVLDYRLWYAEGLASSYSVLAESLTDREYLLTGLTTGVWYKFKVQARNEIGYGDFSEELEIRAAQPPDTPAKPVTSWSPDDVTITWSEPAINGDEITSYTILIRGEDSATYYTETNDCDGSDALIISSQQCSINVSHLRAAPFNLPWGTNVHAKIIASNTKGDSIESNPGKGAIITTKPDAPINIGEDLTFRTSTTLGLTWSEGVSNGGDVIYDYKISYAPDDGSAYTVLASGVTNRYYTVTSLTSGVYYNFKI